MSFKLKHMIVSKIAIILSLCLFLNNTLCIKSYAEESIATQNPLFIPISTLVATVAVGSGIIAKNSSEALEAGNQLVNNVVNNIKSNAIERRKADPTYTDDWKVINGQGQPEEPNDNNKNGKWVALAGGTLASGEIWANKELVSDIMRGVYDLKGYQQTVGSSGRVSSDNLMSNGSASNIALQLAKISNSAVKQFDDFLHCEWWNDKEFTYNDCVFNVALQLGDIFQQDPLYPYMYINLSAVGDKVKYLNLPSNNPFKYYTYSNQYGSLSYYYVNSSYLPTFLDENMVVVSIPSASITVKSRNSNDSFNYTASGVSNRTNMALTVKTNLYPYIGYKWFTENPWQFTNNVYNVNQTFDVNFPNWLQDSINLLNQNIEAVRLGIQSLNNPWDNTQTEVQTGTTPANVINQYINNYYNPENIPDDEEEPDSPVVVPPAIEEPQPTNDYLNNFLLPESITTKFPFCIPFDIARAFRLFSVSQRAAPKWECDLNYGSSTYHIVIDLAMFNDVASFIRPLEFILFLVGLALGTRSLIRG